MVRVLQLDVGRERAFGFERAAESLEGDDAVPRFDCAVSWAV